MSDSPAPQSPSSSSGKASRHARTGLSLALLSMLIVFLLYAGYFTYQHQRHRRASDRMEIAISRLAFHRPAHLTDDQWAFCILSTWNLHSNYGLVPEYVPTDELERIVSKLEARIDAGPSKATIDWLWGEYFRAYPGARSYESWRPTSPANRSRFKAGDHGGYPLSYWRDNYRNLVDER